MNTENAVRLKTNGNRVAVEISIETNIRDDARLQVLMRELLLAASKTESEVQMMSDSVVDKMAQTFLFNYPTPPSSDSKQA